LLKRKLKDINFKQSKTFVLLKQKTNISKNLFIIIKLEKQACTIFAKTISIAKYKKKIYIYIKKAMLCAINKID